MSFDLLVWKWSSSDVPGRAHEIAQTIGKEPPPNCLTSFDAESFVKVVSSHRSLSTGEDNSIIASIYNDSEVPATWIEFDIVLSIADRAAMVIPSLAFKHGLVVYDPQASIIPDPCRPKAFCLTVENRLPLYDPTSEEVSLGLSELNSINPSFAVLEAADGSYVQAAGNPEQMTVEWRKISGDTFRHFVGTRGGFGLEESARIPTSAGFVTVKSNQVLTVKEVSLVLLEFLNGEDLKAVFKWADITKRFLR